ncbi:MAG: hypothetical protein AABW56_04040 [Nanoarchaeota archaeon]
MLYIKYTSESDFTITNAKVASMASEISKVANSAYVYGQDTQLTIKLDFPKNLESIEFNNKDIIFHVKNTQGDIVDIVKQAEVNLFSYGTLPTTPGRKTLIVKSLGSSVLVQIPCTNLDKQCIYSTEFSDVCDDDEWGCMIECTNSVWTLKMKCLNQCRVSNPTC